MEHKILYLNDLSWIEDPNNVIDQLEKEYDENKKNKRKTKYQISLENGQVMEVDFENDPDWALLLEYQHEFYDPNGEFIFNKKIS